MKYLLEILVIYYGFRFLGSGLPTLIYSEKLFSLHAYFRGVFPHDYVSVICLAGACLIARKLEKIHFSRYEKVFFNIAAFVLVSTDFVFRLGSFSLFYANVSTLLTTVLCSVGLGEILIFIFFYLKLLISKLQEFDQSRNHGIMDADWKKLWIIIFMVWLPYALIRYPAGMHTDAFFQISQFLSGTIKTTQWPPFSSALMGSIVWVGEKIFHSYGAGAFLCMISQMLCTSCIFAYTIEIERKLKVEFFLIHASFLIYCFSPLFLSYFTTIIKDAPYTAVLILTMGLFIEELIFGSDLKREIGISVCVFVVCSLRNNGIYTFAVFVIFVLIQLVISFVRKNRLRSKMLIYVMLPVVLGSACYLAYNNVFIPSLGIEHVSKAEALSIPFQQTARYVKYHSEDVTGEEKEVIAAILNYDSLADAYDPSISDPVKGSYHGNDDDLKKYFDVWIEMGKKNPSVYLDAAVEMNYGFFNPKVVMHSGEEVNQFLTTVQEGGEYWPDYGEPEFLIPVKKAVRDVIDDFCLLPPVYVLVNTAVQMWLAVYLCFRAIHDKDENEILIMSITAAGMLTCLLSPTYFSTGQRYALPVITANVLLASMILGRKRNETGESKVDE